MASKFDEILAQGVRAGQVPARTQAARDWFRDKARGTTVTPEAVVRGEKTRYKNRVAMGRMYLFNYDPKTKAELPYYDRYPLIFPVQGAPGGFYGINMHYLPYKLRAQLMDALYDLSSNKRYDENTKLRLSYEVLKGASKYKLFKPTFKTTTKLILKNFLSVTNVITPNMPVLSKIPLCRCFWNRLESTLLYINQ